MKKLPTLFTIVFITFALAFGCNQGGDTDRDTTSRDDRQRTSTRDGAAEEKETPQSIREGKGVGAIENVDLTEDLEESMVTLGNSIYDMKCASCHKLTDQRVVGPGFEGITNRRKPEWIMNMITNTDVMLAEDPEAQKLLEQCLVRMPNQNVSVGDARAILEFLRKNDMERVGEKDQAAS